MSFVTALALAIALLVAVPIAAHRLRRQEADVVPFAPASLVPPTPPRARKRSRLEDRALLAIRALAVVGLALLGASPLVRCSHLALDREGGASVALAVVLDDSASMRAQLPSGKTRFAAAVQGAKQLLSSAREGDAIAVVLAGSPPRVLLAPTTDLGAVAATLDDARPSDRATELSEALGLAEGLLTGLPQVDKKLVLLSDLADGHSDGPPLGRDGKLPLWIPMPELAAKLADCAVITADRSGAVVRVRVACTPGETFAGRAVEVRTRDGERVLGTSSGIASSATEVTVTIPADSPAELVARLAGSDPVRENDAAPVLSDTGPTSLAVIADTATETTVTGGAPVVEQAFAALHTELGLRPLPQVPDRLEDLAAFAGVLVDDPPGLTPEQRNALGAFLRGGGVALFALGPRAAQAPLGATFEPVLTQGVTWSKNPAAGKATDGRDKPSDGVDPASAHALFAESAPSLVELAAAERTTLGPSDREAFESLLAFSDKAPFVARRKIGAGEAWVVTLPFSVNDSDLVLRPGFLAILDNFSDAARRHATLRRSEVGAAWLLPDSRSDGATRTPTITGPDGRPLATTRDADGTRASPGLVGRYELVVDGRTEIRVVSASPRELDTRPRPRGPGADGGAGDRSGTGVRTQTELSWAVALGLLALFAAELVLRVVTKPRATATS